MDNVWTLLLYISREWKINSEWQKNDKSEGLAGEFKLTSRYGYPLVVRLEHLDLETSGQMAAINDHAVEEMRMA